MVMPIDSLHWLKQSVEDDIKFNRMPCVSLDLRECVLHMLQACMGITTVARAIVLPSMLVLTEWSKRDQHCSSFWATKSHISGWWQFYSSVALAELVSFYCCKRQTDSSWTTRRRFHNANIQCKHAYHSPTFTHITLTTMFEVVPGTIMLAVEQ